MSKRSNELKYVATHDKWESQLIFTEYNNGIFVDLRFTNAHIEEAMTDGLNIEQVKELIDWLSDIYRSKSNE